MRTHVKPPDWRNAVGWICCVLAERDPGAFTYCARKKQRSQRKICRYRSLPPNAVLHPALLNRKPVTSCSTSLVTLTWSQSHLQKLRKDKKNQLSCIYLLDKCKRFLPFHVWILWKQNSFYFFFFFFTVNILFISHSVYGCLTASVWPLFMWTVCAQCVSVCVCVCWLVSLKQYEW